jgi:hypothetical protein
MNERIRAIVEEPRKLTPQQQLDLFDVLEGTFVGDEGDGTPAEVEAALDRSSSTALRETRLASMPWPA